MPVSIYHVACPTSCSTPPNKGLFINNCLDSYSFMNVINITIDPEAIVGGLTVKPQIQLPPIQHHRSHLLWLQMKDNGLDDEAP